MNILKDFFNPINTNVANCPACESNKSFTIFNARGLRFVCCRKCLLWYASPMPSNEELTSLYNPGLSRWTTQPDYVKSRTPFFNYYLDLIKKYKDKGVLFDYGCGVGTFLLLAESRGFTVAGADLSENDLVVARQAGIMAVKPQDISQLDLTGKVDVITLLDVIEHLPKFEAVFNFAQSLLKENGIIFIQTGSVGGLGPLIARGQTPFVQNEGHISLFSRRSLFYLLRRFGFRVKATYSEVDYFTMLKTTYPEQYREPTPLEQLKRTFTSSPDMYIVAERYDF